MIQVNELRIGNYINRLGEITIIKSIQIGTNGIGYVYTPVSGAITLNQIEPIPLTPEILEKCGFELKNDTRNSNGWYLNVDNRRICWSDSDKEIVSLYFKEGQNYGYNDTLFDFKCKSLHQLQNLYFALTGEELTYFDVINTH